MTTKFTRILLALLAGAFIPIGGELRAQCPTNFGFDNGNLSNWSSATDSLFIQPANRVHIVPGINTKVVAYGVTDQYLGTITKPTPTVGNYLVRVGNKGVRAVADTVYRTYIIDSLTDKLTIWSKGVSETAHNYWGVPVNESPGFGYEIFVNGRRIDCLRGSFFTGNLDNPPVWQLGTFKDTAGVRKSVGWGKEVINFACFVGDTVEIRLFTRDCILLGHYAYAYFDVQCGDTTKPQFSQIMVNDIIQDDSLQLYCTANATLYLEPQTMVCPIFMGAIQWTPAQYVVGPNQLDSALVQVGDSAWIYAEAEFSNYCMTVNIIDSIFVRFYPSDPHDNLPKLTKNFCDCLPDTVDFTGINVTTIWDNNGTILTPLTNNKLITKPCDNFYEDITWKNPSSRIVTSGSQIGVTSLPSNQGAIGFDTVQPGSRIRYTYNSAAGKVFYIGFNNSNSNNNNDLTHSLYVNGTTVRPYYNTRANCSNKTYSGSITVEFRIASTRHVTLYINGVLVHTYSGSQRASSNVFPDISIQSNHNPVVTSAHVFGPTKNAKDYDRVLNKAPIGLGMTFVDRCGASVFDSIRYIPGFSAASSPDVIQCGLDQLTLNMSSSSLIDRISWSSPITQGTFSAPNNNTPSNNQPLLYNPTAADYPFKPMRVIITATSGRCTAKDTAFISVNEIPLADAGPDITTSADTFQIGGSPTRFCFSCPSTTLKWSQANALVDSNLNNPGVVKNRIGAPYFIATVRDPSTGCFAFDTVFVYTSLSNLNSFMESNCIGTDMVELNWVMLPDKDIKGFGIDYSLDGGNNWIRMHYLAAGSSMLGTDPVAYKVIVRKHPQAGAQYRWYSVTPSEEKTNMAPLNDLACGIGGTLTIHPNPFNDQFYIQFENVNNNSSIVAVILNQYGQVVRIFNLNHIESGPVVNYHIEGLDDLSTGVYLVSIRNADRTLYTGKIIKSD